MARTRGRDSFGLVLMKPPGDESNEPRRRGLMTPDPDAAAGPVSLVAFLWAIAAVLGVVVLTLAALG
jgi:hypothetical protein